MTRDQLARIYEDFWDDEKFCPESLRVLDKHSNIVPMRLGPAQVKLYHSVRRSRNAGKPVRKIKYKARQVWITTYIAARFFRDCIARPGRHTLVLAQDEKTAQNIFQTYKRFYDEYVPFRGIIGKPKLISDRADALEFDNGSWIKIHTARTATIGRSFTIHNLHLSEFAFYGDNTRTLMAAVMSAMPNLADTEAFAETTPNGLGNEFHRMWQLATAGESEWDPVFFGCFEHPEYTMPLVEPADAFQASLSQLERELMQRYELKLGQLYWRRWTIRNVLNGDETLFDQEFPHCPEVGFISSGRPRFDLKAVERMPVVRDAMEGQLEIYDLGGEKRIRFVPIERGPLVIYRQPQAGRQYVIGCDTAEGIDAADGKGSADPDYSAAQVGDRDSGEVVARLRARMTPKEFARHVWRLGVFFNWAQIMPEVNNHGFAFIDGLVGEPLNYPSNLIYHRDTTPEEDPSVRSDLLGWKTTPLTREQLIDALAEAIRQGVIFVHDPITISELRTFLVRTNGVARAAPGYHDDTVIALALMVMGFLRMPRRKLPTMDPTVKPPGVVRYGERIDPKEELRRKRLAA